MATTASGVIEVLGEYASGADEFPYRSIGQDAEVILFIYRAEVIIGKVELTFLGQHTRFANFADPGSF